jgi:hypothetical protein
VLTAKPCHREITNVSREGSTIFQPGDKVKIQYSGLHHPANKLAGIYNMSAYVTYNNIPNGSSLILGAGQYTFGSVPSAQAVTIDIPADYDTSAAEALVMDEGVIQVNGFGDPIGAHRAINKNLGRSPNFTAIAHKTYFGQLPEVRIPISAIKRFTLNLQADVDSVEYTITMDGDTLHPNADGIYTPTYGTYMIKASKPGYRCFRTELTLAEGDEEEQTCIIEMVEAGANGWDGTTLSEPELKDGIYLICNGAELAWFATKVNGGDYNISAKLVNDIDLCAFDWTPIGGAKSNTAYQGTFEGDGYTIDGLYINNTNTYQALLGYIKDSHISGITVAGEVSAKQYAAGIVAYMGTKTYVNRCVNKANITGTSTYVGGITGSVSQATSELTNSYNLGNIKGTTNCAGVAGYNHKSAIIENVFSLGEVTGNTVAACIGGTTAKDNAKNVFATKEYDIIEGQTTVTDSLMASGEVAYLLGEAFGQQIGTDLHPVFGGASVYKVTYTTSLSEEVDSLYTNDTLPQLDDMSDPICVWKSSPDGEELTEVTTDSTLFVEYRYIITFLVDGVAIKADTLAYGRDISLPEEPVKEGHTFSGWSEVPATMPANNITVSGSFVVNKYNVYYYVGEQLVHTEEVAYGAAMPSYEYEPSNGDIFNGWDGEHYDTMPAHDVIYIANIMSSISLLQGSDRKLVVYDLNGRRIMDMESLKSGLYIINDKKVLVK